MPESNFTQRRLWLAVNSHGWEDFPVHHQGQQAAELLACWGALWHPAVLHGSLQVPQWQRIDELPDPAGGSILMVPEFARSLLPEANIRQLAELGGACCFGDGDRMANAQKLLELSANDDAPISDEVVRDFFALGYCYLQVQLMTRQLRYVSTLDNVVLSRELLEAVRIVFDGDTTAYRRPLQACFDQLLQERNRYYPTCAALIDCVCLTGATLGPGLKAALLRPHRFTLQAAGSVFEKIEQAPENAGLFQQIGERLDSGSLSLAAGPWIELATPLLSLTTEAEQVDRGRESVRRAFPQARVTMFARRRFGLGRSLPGILKLAGYEAAIHSTLDDGTFPQTTVNNMRWQGDDLSTIDALATAPKLADASATWLGLGVTIGGMTDASHYSSVFLVHWPGQESDSYEDLVNSVRFGDILGKFVTLDEYFGQVSDPGYSQNYRADDYRNPFLRQMVRGGEADPVSRFARYWHQKVELLALQGLHAMLGAMGSAAPSNFDGSRIARSIDAISEAENPGPSDSDRVDLPDMLMDAAARFHAVVAGTGGKGESDARRGTMLVNPFGFPQKCVERGGLIDLPACGYSWLDREHWPEPVRPAARGRRNKPVPMVVDGQRLQNEFFFLDINPATGGIGAIKFHNRRGALLSQQIALRQAADVVSRSGKRQARYSQMVADEIVVGECSSLTAAIESHGRLMMDSRQFGQFRQVTRIERGSPVVRIEIGVDLNEAVTGEAWDNYLANRIAWNDESSDMYSWLLETRQPTSLQQITAPLALEIDQHTSRICLLPGGLPFHQRIGYRRLDTLLVVPGETARHWILGIGVDVAYPLTAAMSFLCGPLRIEDAVMAGSTKPSGWLFYLNCKNVAAIRWQLTGSGRGADCLGPGGVRLLVRETEGRAARVALDSARRIRHAFACDLSGQRIAELTVREGRAEWEMVAHEIAHVELVW